MPDSRDVVTVERLIPAPAEPIFDLVAHPERHRDIDGSGTVRDAREGSGRRLALGSRFGMSMRAGLPYSMDSEVVEFDEGRRLAWQTRGHGFVGRFLGGRIWRYELEPVEGGTLVKESWDIRQESPLTRPAVRLMAKKTEADMRATLERIEELVVS